MKRQGDLLFVPEEHDQYRLSVADIVQDGILARGEATGHTHRLRASRENLVKKLAGVMYILAKTKAFIDHEEHGTVELEPATYKVIRQQEYTPAGWQQVAD